MSTATGAMSDGIDADAYLERLGCERPVEATTAALADLQYAHLVAVPFENLDIVFAGGVAHDQAAAIAKILAGRGGWCFELNGAFATLLTALGYDVRLIGAAVLLDGPSKVLDHLALEVTPTEVTSTGADDGAAAEGPMLVDVGFGETFVRPLELNRAGAQDGGTGDFEFMPSPQGTTLTEVVDGVPEARYRFKRVAHRYDDFAPIAASMQRDPSKHWRSKPFATRLLGVGTDRVTLTHDTLKLMRNGTRSEQPVSRSEWDDTLDQWFGIERPGPWPDTI